MQVTVRDVLRGTWGHAEVIESQDPVEIAKTLAQRYPFLKKHLNKYFIEIGKLKNSKNVINGRAREILFMIAKCGKLRENHSDMYWAAMYYIMKLTEIYHLEGHRVEETTFHGEKAYAYRPYLRATFTDKQMKEYNKLGGMAA